MKFTLTLADGTTKTYSRKVDAMRAGEKSGGAFRLVNPKGEVVVDGLELDPAAFTAEAPAVTVEDVIAAATEAPAPVLDAVEDVDCGGCQNAEHCSLNADETECECCGAGKKKVARRPAKQSDRTWDATESDVHTCAGACGETKPAKAYPTTKTPGRRGAECRKCRDARLKG